MKSNEAEYIIHDEADEAFLGELRKFYAPYNDRLYELIGRQFSW